jgi:hypothetical protein
MINKFPGEFIEDFCSDLIALRRHTITLHTFVCYYKENGELRHFNTVAVYLYHDVLYAIAAALKIIYR